jgi:alpha-galactosidase/6-phospho-beta-glucosidase family protein
MNKEFEDWVDQKVAKYVPPDTPLTRDAVSKILTDALIEVANIPDTIRAREAVDVARYIAEQAKITQEECLEAMNKCCMDQSGKKWCETFGCGDMKRIAVQMQAVLSKWDEWRKSE